MMLIGFRMINPGRAAIGTWSGGRYLRFGETIDEERLEALLRPGEGDRHLLSADTYGQGEADELLGRALAASRVRRYAWSAPSATTSTRVSGTARAGFPRFTDPRLRGPGDYAYYLRMAAEKSLERVGATHSTCCCSTTPTAPATTARRSGTGWRRSATRASPKQIGVAPGPANGFTLDLIACLERFGDRIDWAMVILNPSSPGRVSSCLGAAAESGVRVITRVVDYGGLFWGDIRPGMELARRPPRLPARRAGSRPASRSSSGCCRSPNGRG